MPSYTKDKKALIARLRKMEGQLQGIRRMVEEDRYCVDVLNQLSSIIAAAHKVSSIILGDHIRGCVSDALRRNEQSDDYVNELIGVVDRFAGRK
jgi:DNA-binding FrmR family transcriptional regulator